MIKKILDWILGKSEPVKAAEAPYKVEATAPVFAPEVVDQLQAAHDAVVASGQPDDSKGLDEAIAAQAAQPVVETAPVTVKAKYKKTDLNKMTKAELLALAAKHGVEVKSRAPKADLVKALTKV
jgi:hypothetical protein